MSDVRDGETWKDIEDMHVRDGEAWKQVEAVYVRDEGSWKLFFGGPTNLTAQWDSVDCQMELSWDANPDESQDIHRCSHSGSGCDPVDDGNVVKTVSAGVGSWVDPTPDENDSVVYAYVVSAGSRETDPDETGTSQCVN